MTETEATPESTPPSNSGLVDLSDLRMMPAWVAGMGGGSTSQQQNRRYEEEESRGGGGGRRDDRRGGPPGRGGQGGGGGRGEFRGRRDGPPGGGGGGHGGPRRDDRGGPRRFSDRGGEQRPQREWQEMPKDIQVTIEPEEKAAEALSHHIRGSGHAFSMFDAARLVLAEGDRFHARFTCANGRPNGIFVTPDGGMFLTQDEALQHVLRGAALDSYYRVEEIELEEPKGDFKSIGVCGMSGELLGPPSHHSFQTALIRLHRERFSHMPLEDYKRRVRVDSNPELVAQWKEKQKKGQRWISLKDQPAEGEEPVTLSSRAEMEAHFRKVHANTAVREVKEAVIVGNIEKAKLTHVFFLMLRNAVENARKHLFEMSQKLGGGFERRGLKLFKRRAGKLFVSRVKPRAIDPGVVFSERVAKIVESLKAHPGMPLHQLVETLVPSAVPLEPAPEGGAAPKVPLTEEQISVIKDIRWLANEGYVIEYSDGLVCLGVQGEPNPVKTPAAIAEATAAQEEAAAAAAAPESGEAAPAPESPVEETPAAAAPVAMATEEEPAVVDIAASEAPVPPMNEEAEKVEA